MTRCSPCIAPKRGAPALTRAASSRRLRTAISSAGTSQRWRRTGGAALAPALEAVATELKGKVKVVKIDVDENPSTTTKYGIQAMPTILLFKDGKVVNHKVGAMVQKRQLADWINGTSTA